MVAGIVTDGTRALASPVIVAVAVVVGGVVGGEGRRRFLFGAQRQLPGDIPLTAGRSGGDTVGRSGQVIIIHGQRLA